MKIDPTIAKAVDEVAKKLNIDPKKVIKILDSYYKGVKFVGSQEEYNVIKMDFLGKFSFSKMQKEYRDKGRKLYLEKKEKEEERTRYI